MSVITKFKQSSLYNSAVIPYHIVRTATVGARAHWPGKKLTVIGVTGTNGKTTTCFMIWKMLNAAGHKTGLMTTVAWGVDQLENQIEHMTTVDAATLNQRIAKIAASGAEFLVLEVTSHALAQHRILGVPIDTAVFTNLTHEHLDYHRTFENYRAAKVKLFKKAKFGIVNADDPNSKYFAREVTAVKSYGLQQGDLQARNIELRADGVRFTADGQKFQLHLPGEFNVSNALAAILVGQHYGLKNRQIAAGLKTLEAVEGRMNLIDEGQNFQVLVDFAHTPDAFEQVFHAVAPAYGGTRAERAALRASGKAKTGSASSAGHASPAGSAGQNSATKTSAKAGVKPATKAGAKPAKLGRIITLFGGAGFRDESTRPERGAIAGKYSDIIIITEDDSRTEDPVAIANDFKRGVRRSGFPEKDLYVELNRQKAIRLALSLARRGDLILILGKGHEKTILRADGPHPFEDLKVTKKELCRLLRGKKTTKAAKTTKTKATTKATQAAKTAKPAEAAKITKTAKSTRSPKSKKAIKFQKKR